MREPDDDHALMRSSAVRIPAPVRHQRIMDVFNADGFVSVTDVARDIGVSPMTIRRDLAILGRDGLLTRTYGGAVAAQDSDRTGHGDGPLFDQRMAENAVAKKAIAKAASALIQSRESVGLDVGTTLLALAAEIAGRPDLRFFTNNVRAALELAGAGSPVYVLGGEVRTPEFSVVGTSAVAQLTALYLDRVFIGVSGISDLGIFDFSPEDAEVKRSFIDVADCVVVLCDASKFQRRAVARIATLDAIDILVTDQPPRPPLAAALATANVRVIVADR